MGPILLIAIAAAAASALLAAGVAAGSVLAVPLFYLAPLPVMIAGLAFSPIAAGLAVVFASIGLGVMFGGTFLVAYAVGLGGPAFGLAYAALLARPGEAGRDGLVWFPVSGLALLAAVFGTVGVCVALISMATDYESYKAVVTASFDALVGPPGEADDASSAGAFMAHVLPPMAGIITMVSQLICLYLAARATRISQRLPRPWPVISALRLPRAAVAALAVALVLTMLLPGMLGLAASVAAATVLSAFVMGGFAVMHAVSINNNLRVLVLAVLWITALVFGWPMLALAALGIADTFLDLRATFARGAPPRAANDR